MTIMFDMSDKFFCTLLLFGFFGFCPLPAQAVERVVIHRDSYGVPHIYGDSEEAAMFAHGYAQAEDRLESILKAYLKVEGKMASVFGESWVEEDYRQRAFKHFEISQKRYNELSSQTRKDIESYIYGLKKFMKDHPEKVPAWAPEPTAYHPVALGRYMIWGWPLGQAMSDLQRAGIKMGYNDNKGDSKELIEKGYGSNQWVIGRKRSAEKGAIAMIDPHVSWQGEWLFYEAHLHGGNLNVFGFAVAGTPFIALGHNDYLSWAATTGGPDTADVYEEQLNPQNPTQYSYDGSWRDISIEKIEIAVKTDKTEKGVRLETREARRSHHGLIVSAFGNKAYAIKLSYENEVQLSEQILGINRSRNLGEFLQAMSLLQYMPQNIMYGDIYGNMFYIRTGRVPTRPEGYWTRDANSEFIKIDWSKPVPGNISATEWQGIHPQEELVQLLNPAAGFMQNCNISPGTMTFNSPLTPDRYLSYIYNASADGSNPRGRRFLEVMQNSDEHPITKEMAFQIALDDYLHGVDIYQKALVESFKAHSFQSEFAQLGNAIKVIENWDRHAKIDSVGITLYRF